MPLNELAVANRVVGIRSVKKALLAGTLKKLFLAGDARRSLISGLEEGAKKAEIPVESVESMILLGRACAISRGAAAAGIARCGESPLRSSGDA
ncbi:MAG: ribosomal L7Ae/L30e/S12e/Gadd45 family protein [Thermovirgaceae bacterium]|nr:ribosomal L7Ae/L30e/S12e/Gadd45 family protein [Thermovirgaceae bacterium]